MRKRLTALVTALLLVLGMLPAGALANAMEAWTTDRVVEPTCTEQGYTVESNFITMETRNVNYTDPLGHAWGEWETEDATCEQDGYRQRKCSRCGTYEVQEIPAGHQMGAWHQVTALVDREGSDLRGSRQQAPCVQPLRKGRDGDDSRPGPQVGQRCSDEACLLYGGGREDLYLPE